MDAITFETTNVPDPATARRKRSRVACDFCHSRKVRCDLTVTGAPCTNCRLDQQSCFVRESRNKRPKRSDGRNIAAQRRPSTAATTSQAGQLATLSPPGMTITEALENTLAEETLLDFPFAAFSSPDRSFPTRVEGGLSSIAPTLGENSSSSDVSTLDKSVIFPYYEFLELKQLSELSPADVRYLDSKGCFRVPATPYLEDYLHEYFLHVHPCMPVVDEAEFWSSYEKEGRSDDTKVSLLLFQAMLFAASAFVPSSSIRASGFLDSHEARETLHRRAALLLQLAADTDHTTMAQAALLLSFQSSAVDVYSNTTFLSTAIHAARASQAHLYKALHHLTERQRLYKKRLWWCCVVRDRTIALGVRRPLQITPETFDPHHDRLVEEDLECEMQRSRVYDTDIKQCLIKVFLVQCDLAVALTSTIMTVFPPNCVPIPMSPTREDLLRVFAASEGCRQELKVWYEKAEGQLRHASRTGLGRTSFMTLYVDLQWIYYFTAQMALSHFIIFMSSTSSHALKPDWIMRLDISKSDLMTAFIGLKNVFKRLVASNLAGHLPISASAYTAVPLLLISLDVELSASENQKEKRMRDLSFCAEAMKQYGHRFRFAQFVSEIVCKVLRLMNGGMFAASPPGMPEEAGNRPRAWSELYLYAPQLYFKLLFSLEYSLSWGKVPSAQQFPDWSRTTSVSRATPSPKSHKSPSANRRLSVGLNNQVPRYEMQPGLAGFGQNPVSAWMAGEEWESLLSLPPVLSAPVYCGEATAPENDDEVTIALASPSVMSPEKIQPLPRVSAAGSDGCESISDTLSFMLQYSCPAIG
ncbi:fungal-specific transcription factor domain-containing protein [Aspergillus pseudoustus]|uniref:Fungal-specific transcription factor domain-containing protein n=1 Tax=Aspergillus pseudoustus TaxID=1810923 RepID=A0ABR4IM67_9EURO